ncbi:hypothetical protein MKW92_013630 [Papaver armeniacum]|nr:hypothetical protein MKW92_013630 [Papaver armeniacum]
MHGELDYVESMISEIKLLPWGSNSQCFLTASNYTSGVLIDGILYASGYQTTDIDWYLS